MLAIGDRVIIETKRGPELATVVTFPKQIPLEKVGELKPIIRKATPEDLEQANEFREKAVQAIDKFVEIANELNLPMKPVSARYTLDGKYLFILFTADGRVDFRELVHQLSSQLKTRVELHQVGPRDEAKLLGGLGPCGRPLCCSIFLNEFSPVSIKMAKEQGLSLDPTKVSGVCGRLLCCLAYEAEYYRSVSEKAPHKGQNVKTSSGEGVVTGINILKETASVEIDKDTIIEVPLDEIIPEEG